MAGQTLRADLVINVLTSKSLSELPHPLQFLCYQLEVFPLGRLGKPITGVLF